MKEKNVFIYGTSGHPPLGMGSHQGYVQYFTSLPCVDELWIIPVFQHPYLNKQKELIDWNHRFRLCQIAFEENEAVNLNQKAKVVSLEKELFELKAKDKSIENELNQVSIGTYELILHIKKKFPNYLFTVIMGGDAYCDFSEGKWGSGKKLLKEVGLVVVQRLDGTESFFTDIIQNSISNPPIASEVIFVKIPHLSDWSSTYFRKLAKEGNEKLYSKLIDPKVLTYLRVNHLYGLNDE